MEEDTMASMSTSASISPLPIESDSKQGSSPGGPSLVFAKRKKLEIRDVFAADEDDTAAPKKRKLVPLGWHANYLIMTNFNNAFFVLISNTWKIRI